ncbi:MAG: pyridoxal 5'-phosphate synthase glutaminase subunit PdxT [bacterium]
MLIGVLALQGAVSEHLEMLRRLGCEALPVRDRETLSSVSGLILPGGESTTVGMLLNRWELLDSLRARAHGGMPVFGTCTGMIILAREILDGLSNQPVLGLMDISVRRNAFGRQQESFEAPIQMGALGKTPFPGVFIRAPYIEKTGKKVEILAAYEEKIVAAREKNFLVSAFHPELTADCRLHDYFISMCAQEPAAKKEMSICRS